MADSSRWKSFEVMTDRWLGISQDVNPLVIGKNKWADSLNVDDRFGWPRLGTQSAFTTPNEGRGYWTYRRPDGTLHEVMVLSDGTINEDGVQVGSGVSLGAQSLSAASGNGTIVVARGNGQKPWWRDTADGAWKELSSVPFAFDTVGMMSRGPRLVGAPGGLGLDSIAWSSPSNFTKWGTADGGGAEVIGMDSEPVRVLLDGLQDDFAVYKDNSIWVIRGGNPTSWEIVRASTDIGCISASATAKIGRGHAFVHTSGIYLINSIGQVTWPPLTWRIQSLWDTIKSSAFLRKSFCTYDSTQQTLWTWVPTSSSSDLPFSKLIKVHLPTSSLTLHNLSAGAARYNNNAAAIKISQGTSVFTMTGLSDNGVGISSSLTLPILAGPPYLQSKLEIHKRWGYRDRIYLVVESQDASPVSLAVTPTLYLDSTKVTLNVQNLTIPANQTSRIPVVLTPSTLGWGLQLQLNQTTTGGGVRLIGVTGFFNEISDLRDT